MRWATPLFCGLLLLVAQSPLAHADKRVALVIGNAAYERAVPLANPVHDAADISALLKGLGFEVIEGTDLKRSKMRETVRRFGDALEGADVGLFFYAGHGLQVAGENYLIPIDGELARERDLAFEAIKLSLVLSQMERETKTNIVFLDACRDNPMVQTLARAMGTRSTAVGRGLARVESGVGTFIAFATQPGNVALDGKGRNSPFSAALIKHVGTDGVDLSGIMIAVRNDVLASTAGKQVPWEHSSLTGQFFFKPAVVPAETPVAGSEERAPSGEIALWTSVKDSDDPAMLQTYLDRFPTGTFSGLARLMRGRLVKEKSAEPEKTVVAAIASGTAASAGAPPGARFLT